MTPPTPLTPPPPARIREDPGITENLGKLEVFEQLFLSLGMQERQTTWLKILPKFSLKSNAVSARAMLREERIYKCHDS